MKYVPLPCQEEGTRFIVEYPRSGLLIRMGIGKTVAALTAIVELIFNYVLVKRVLVIAPKRVATITWPDEIKKWDHTKGLTYTVLHGDKKLDRLKSKAGKVDVTIINYEGLAWLSKYQRYMPKYDMIVFDESTYLKNGSSGRTKLAHELSRGVQYIVIMTGTFKPNGLANLWSQMFLLDRGKRLGQNITAFRTEYMIAGESRGQWFPKAGARKRVLDKIKDIVLVVEDEKGVGLPKVKDNVITVELPPGARTMYNKLERDWATTFDDGKQLTLVNVQAQTQKLRQLTAGFLYTDDGVRLIHKAKLEALKELIDSISGNVLVAINFKYEVQLIRDYLGYEVPAIYSDTSQGQSTKWIREWMSGSIPLMLVNPQSMSHGLNLQGGGKDIIWFSLTWDLEYWQQLIARLRRRGSLYDCIMNHILRVKDTMDDVMLSCVTRKGADQAIAIEYLKAYRKRLKI